MHKKGHHILQQVEHNVALASTRCDTWLLVFRAWRQGEGDGWATLRDDPHTAQEDDGGYRAASRKRLRDTRRRYDHGT